MTTSISLSLTKLNLSYPLWLFDLDQTPWPRELASVLPGSRPAKISGWYPWPWEYGTSLYRNDDELSENIIDTRPRDRLRTGDAARVLEMLRWDDGFGEGTFEIFYEAGGSSGGEETKDFGDWVFEKETEGYIDPRRVVRMRRKWDGVLFWDREECWNLFDEGEAEKYTCFGVASLVKNEEELVFAAGVRRREIGAGIRKAEFQLLDGAKEIVRGIIFPDRYHADRGLTLGRGPKFLHNIEVLAGTALEGKDWSAVEDYVHGMKAPLWPTELS